MAKKKAIKRVFCFFVILAILMSAMPISIFAMTSNVTNASGKDETFLGTHEDSNVFSHVKAISLTSRTVSEAPKEEWNKTFGSTGDDEAWTVQQTDDGGYILAGDTLFETGLCSAWLVKTNSNGDMEWEETFRGTGFDSACSVQQTGDGGYILAGDTLFETGLCTAWLVKTNSQGDMEWEQTFRGTGFDSASSVRQTTDGGYILAGNTLFETGLCSAWLVKTNSQGDMEWEKTFGITGFDSVSSVQQTTDGGYILAGDTLSSDAGLTAAWLLKTNPQGEVKWEATFGGSGLDSAYSANQTADGGYILAGETLSFYTGLCTAWLVKTNAKGIKEWEKTYGKTGLDSAYAVQQTTDGGYVFAGETFSLGAYGWTDAWLVKTDSEGNKKWERTFGGSGDDLASAVQQTADGGYVIAGCTDSYGDGYYDAWLIKVKGTTGLTEFPDLTLENTGFESGELDPWYSTKYYDPYKKCEWIIIGVDSEAHYEGDYGAYVDVQCSLDAWGRIIQEPVEITPGEKLAVEAKMMYDGDLNDGYTELWLVFLDADKKSLDHVYKKYYESDFDGEDKWVSAVLPATTAPSNAKYVRVMVGLADVKSCRLNIDNVILKYGSATGNHPPTATKIEPTSDSITIEPGDTQEFKVKAEDVDEEEHNNLKMIEWFVDDVRMETDAADGTSAEVSFSYTFENAGTFSVKATAYDEQMEEGSVTWEVNVIAEPKVPYYAQGPTDWCYITSFAMVAQYWGVRVHSWDISDKLDMSVDDYTGLTWIDDARELVGDKFSDVAEDYNLNAVSGIPIASPICDLKDEIIKPLNRQHPVIVGIQSEGHAVVVADHKIDNGDDFFYVYDPGDRLRNGRISWVSASDLIGGNLRIFIVEIYPKEENKEPDPPMVGLYLLPDCREIRHEWQGRMESATFMGEDGLVYRTRKDLSVPGFNDLPEGELNWLRWADTHDPGMLLINDLHCSNTNDFDITCKLEITNEENNDILYTDMVTIPANTANHEMRIELPLERIGEGNIRLKITMGGDEIGPMNINVMRPSVTGETFTNSIGMEFVLIPVGEFEMGSPDDEVGRDSDEGPVHHVTIKNAFYMGRYEVTQKQWRAIMGDNPFYFEGDDLPVEMVSWDDVQEFIKKLNEKEGTNKYRLPSEEEWEYACRAGTTTRYSFGDSESELGDYAWYYDNSDHKTHPVGQKKPNSWGLYDMHGNVWEWMYDVWYNSYDHGARGSTYMVVRGGGWYLGAGYCRSARRLHFDPGFRDGNLGFRLLKEQ